jgi:hypothetical protein
MVWCSALQIRHQRQSHQSNSVQLGYLRRGQYLVHLAATARLHAQSLLQALLDRLRVVQEQSEDGALAIQIRALAELVFQMKKIALHRHQSVF